MRLTFALLLFGAVACAQQGPLVPDCFMSLAVTTTTATNSTNFDNGVGPGRPGLGCVDWTVVYFATTTVATLSVELDAANDTAGAPGAFTAFGGTLINGTNPNTTLNEGSAQMTGYFPWVRLRISGVTGTGIVVNAFAFGYRPIAFFLQKASTATSNITQLGGNNVTACLSQAFVNLSASGNTQVIAASGSNRTLICHYDVALAQAANFKLTFGTGANCGAGTTDATALKANLLTDAEDYTPFSPWIIPASQAVCVNLSAAVNGGINLVFTQIP